MGMSGLMEQPSPNSNVDVAMPLPRLFSPASEPDSQGGKKKVINR